MVRDGGWETGYVADFEDGGGGIRVKECKYPLEAGKGKDGYSLLEFPERRAAL